MQKNYKFKYESSRRSQEAITRFNYYLEEIIPSIFQNQHSSKGSSIGDLQFAPGNNQVAYFHAHKSIEGQNLVDEESILHAAKALHLEKVDDQDSILRINDRSFRKSTGIRVSFLPISRQAHEVLEIIVQGGEHKENCKSGYELYIIHHCHCENGANSLKWLNVKIILFSSLNDIPSIKNKLSIGLQLPVHKKHPTLGFRAINPTSKPSSDLILSLKSFKGICFNIKIELGRRSKFRKTLPSTKIIDF